MGRVIWGPQARVRKQMRVTLRTALPHPRQYLPSTQAKKGPGVAPLAGMGP